MTTGDYGVVLQGIPTYFNASRQVVPYFIDPASTVTLLIQQAVLPELSHETYPMTIAPDGYSASYTTVGSEFPQPGLYRLTMRILLGASRLTADYPVVFFVEADFTP